MPSAGGTAGAELGDGLFVCDPEPLSGQAAVQGPTPFPVDLPARLGEPGDGMATSPNLLVPLLAMVIAAVVSFALCPLLAKFASRLGLMDEPDSGRKRHDRPIPLVGGVAVALGAGAALLWADCNLAAWLLVGGMGSVGFLDDLVGLRPGPKFTLQLLLPSALCAAFLLPSAVRSGLLAHATQAVPIILIAGGGLMLFIALLTNAFNFTDNSNGQCAGLAIVSLSAEGAILWIQGDGVGAMFPLAFAAAFLGFLPWNYPAARAFLGDCGSHIAGCSVAWGGLGVLVSRRPADAPILAAGVALILAVPLLDMLVAVGGRLRRGQAPWKGDLTHLSHRLVARGLKPAAAVGLLWFAALVTSAAGVFLLIRK